MKTTTQLTLKHLRKLGYTCEVVERWNGFAKRRQDLFGFADIICFDEDSTVLVQTTTAANLASRRKKITSSPTAFGWLQLPTNDILLIGWRKKKNRWAPISEWILLSACTPPDSTGKRTRPA